MLLEYDCKISNMPELITEFFSCKTCEQNYSISYEEIKDRPTTCNSCWSMMEIWERYEDPDLKNKNYRT